MDLSRRPPRLGHNRRRRRTHHLAHRRDASAPALCLSWALDRVPAVRVHRVPTLTRALTVLALDVALARAIHVHARLARLPRLPLPSQPRQVRHAVPHRRRARGVHRRGREPEHLVCLGRAVKVGRCRRNTRAHVRRECECARTRQKQGRYALVSGGSLSTMGGTLRVPAAVNIVRSFVSPVPVPDPVAVAVAVPPATAAATAPGAGVPAGAVYLEPACTTPVAAFCTPSATCRRVRFRPAPPPSTLSPAALSTGSPIPPGPLPPPPCTNGLGTLAGFTTRSNASIGINSSFLRTSSGMQLAQFLILTNTRSRSLYREWQTYRGQPGYQKGGRGRPRMCRAVNWTAIFSRTSSMGWSAKRPLSDYFMAQRETEAE